MKITLCALSKILQLSSTDSCFRIQLTGSTLAGALVNLASSQVVTSDDLIISAIPKVVADRSTVMLLGDTAIDFDSNTENFIISNRGNES